MRERKKRTKSTGASIMRFMIRLHASGGVELAAPKFPILTAGASGVTWLIVRSFIACLVLVCVGMSLPASGSTLHLCLCSLFEEWTAADDRGHDCCPGHEEPEDHSGSCCIDLEKLPDATAPSPDTEVPAASVSDLPPAAVPVVVQPRSETAAARSAEWIRGPTGPPAERSILSVWRL